MALLAISPVATVRSRISVPLTDWAGRTTVASPVVDAVKVCAVTAAEP